MSPGASRVIPLASVRGTLDQPEVVVTPTTVEGFIASLPVPGLRLRSNPEIGVCPYFRRDSFTGGGCAVTILNGAPISPVFLDAIDPYTIEAIAVLRPEEARIFWGIRGEAGAVLIWTSYGN